MPGKAKKSKSSSKTSKRKGISRKSTKGAKSLSLNPQLEVIKKKVIEFLSLKDTKRVAIVADNDQDGMTSAIQMQKFLLSKRVDTHVFFYDHYSRSFSFPQGTFHNFSPEKTIFLDLNEGFISDILLQIGKATGPFLVIDHHQGDVIRNNSYRCLVIKPKSFSEVEPSRYPVTKMVYDLFGGVDWICCVGIIGDFAFEQWADFLKETEKKYKITNSRMREVDDLVACVTAQYPEKINSLFEFLCKAKSPKEVISSEFFALKKLFDSKIAVQKKLYYETAECYEDVGACFFHCDHRISSKLSNIISIENPHKVILIFEQPGNKIKCSIRRQDFKVNCGDLAKIGVAGTTQGKGGGHIPAAGATFPAEYLEEFKKRVRLSLLQNPPKA